MSSSWVPRNVQEPGGFGYELRRARGLPPMVMPPDAAGYFYNARGTHFVTWKQIHAERAEQQQRCLEWKRRPDQAVLRPAQVWTFRVSGWLFGGWWCYLRTMDQELAGDGPKRQVTAHSALARHLMQIIPLGLFPLPENFDRWQAALARRFPKTRTKTDPRRAGIVTGWTDGSWFELHKHDFQARTGART